MKQKGASLIELIIVILLVGILAAGSAELLRLGFLSYATGASSIEADTQGRIALERMKRDIRDIPSSSDITSASATALTFIDSNGTSITYQLSGTNLMRNSDILAKDIQTLSFGYYDSVGALAVTTATIRYITVSLVVNNGATSLTLITGVSLWNLLI